MKTKLLALAAVIGLAVVSPSLALAHTGDHAKTALVKKQKAVKHVVKHKKIRMAAKLNCAKPIVVKGVKQCPPSKDAAPK